MHSPKRAATFEDDGGSTSCAPGKQPAPPTIATVSTAPPFSTMSLGQVGSCIPYAGCTTFHKTQKERHQTTRQRPARKAERSHCCCRIPPHTTTRRPTPHKTTSRPTKHKRRTMVFPKILKAAVAAAVVLLSTVTRQTDACTCIAVYFTPCDYVTGLASPDTSLVVRATALSRSDQTDINDPVTYTVDVTTVFLGDICEHEEISFVTGGNSAACGVYLEIGEEYVLALSPAVADPFDPTVVEGQLTVNACGLATKWSDIVADEKADLEAHCAE